MTGRWGIEWESPLKRVDVDGPLRKLRSMMYTGKTALQVSEYVARKHVGLTNDPLKILTKTEARLYKLAVDKKDWRLADRIYIEALRAREPAMLQATLDAEGWARAWNVILCEELARIGILWRWIDLEELQSYLGGTFQSRIEKDGGLRLYKAFSVDKNAYSINRPVTVVVPINRVVRSAVKATTYTALPRQLEAAMERMDDKKYVKYANETECRIPDGTRVPRGTKIQVRLEKIDQSINMARLHSVCDSLKGVADVSLI